MSIYKTTIQKALIESENKWVCVITRNLPFSRPVVVTIGTFHFEAQAKRWAKDAIKRKAWRNGSELPDSLG